MKGKATPKKKAVVKEFEDLIVEYPIIGAANMTSLPTKTVQQMRAKLRKKGVVLKMTKRRLMKIAIENVKEKKKGIENIIPELKGMPALIFTKENPFALYKFLDKNKSSAPAKPGQVAPKEIVVKAGPTSFSPGPIIGELGGVGIKAGVEGGKIAIKEDSVVAKEGDTISQELAGILTRLGVEPMEIGLDMVAVYEEGNVYSSKILAIDEDEYMNNLTTAATWAFNLAVEAAITTPDTTELLLQKAFRDSKAVALEGGVMADAVAEEMLAKAERQMLALKAEANVPDAAAAEEPKAEVSEGNEGAKAPEEKPEEKPAEEAKEEKPVEEAKAEPTEEPKAEEKPAEEVKEEAKASEGSKEAPASAPEEPKKEEKAAEEKAEEAKPAEESKAEEPKAEEKPEESKEEKAEETAEKAEEAKD